MKQEKTLRTENGRSALAQSPRPSRMAIRKSKSTAATVGVEVLISHSSADAKFAKSLADYLLSGLRLREEDIRCTSVDGYRLPGGALTDEQLRTELLAAKVVIGLLTPNSLASAFVLFELGARWGSGKKLIPLFGRGMSASDIPAPLKAYNALNCTSGPQLRQLLKETSAFLGRPGAAAPAYERQLDGLQIAAGQKVVKRHDSASATVNLPYVGEWKGCITWTDEWAIHLWGFEPVNTNSSGETIIYRSASGSYRGLGLWKVNNDDNPYAVAAVEMSHFVFREDGVLLSLDTKAQARRPIVPTDRYPPSPVYTLRFTECATELRLKGQVTIHTKAGRSRVVGQVLFERI